MSRFQPLAMIVLAQVSVLAGCTAPVDEAAPSGEDVDAMTQAIEAANGMTINGSALNGRSVNGRSVNGGSLGGVRLSGARLGEAPLDALSLTGSRLSAGELGPKDLVGARLEGFLDDDTTVVLRIDAVKKGHGSLSDVLTYSVSALTDTSWVPLCGVDDQGAPRAAIPLAGRWDYGQGVPGGGAKIDDPTAFTFACEGAALAKCVETGYAPWSRVKVCPAKGPCTQVSLAPVHQACTRMLRADYCGDGSSFTADGTLINVYDAFGVQDDTEAWSFEAEWMPDGARCAARQRLSDEPVPSCWPNLLRADCGAKTHFYSGTLLMSEDAYGP